MKKLKPITIGWGDLITPIVKKPEGFSTVDEIAESTGMSTTTIRVLMKKARKEGTVEYIKCFGPNGSPTLCYKD